MKGIVFLTLDEVLEIHRDQIHRYGGTLGIRELELLQSAIAIPQAGFGGQYLHTNIFEMAAAYLFHIVQNHPFLDGNKRTGTVAALIFLILNNIEIVATENKLENIVRSVAENKKGKAELAEFFKKNSKH